MPPSSNVPGCCTCAGGTPPVGCSCTPAAPNTTHMGTPSGTATLTGTGSNLNWSGYFYFQADNVTRAPECFPKGVDDTSVYFQVVCGSLSLYAALCRNGSPGGNLYETAVAYTPPGVANFSPNSATFVGSATRLSIQCGPFLATYQVPAGLPSGFPLPAGTILTLTE